MEDIVGATAVVVIGGLRNPVNNKADMISGGDVRIKASVILHGRVSRGIRSYILRNVGRGPQVLSATTPVPTGAGVLGAGPAAIHTATGETRARSDLSRRKERRIQRRTDIQPSRNGVAVYALDQTSGGAGNVSNEAFANDGITGGSQVRCRYASSGCQSVEGRS